VVLAATSSIEQMLIVDKVNGMPNFSAARAPRISPSACCRPVMPVGAIATALATGYPGIVEAGVAVLDVHRQLAQIDPGEVGFVGAVVALGEGAKSVQAQNMRGTRRLAIRRRSTTQVMTIMR